MKSVKNCIIHIGMPKTGTTSLQRTLSRLDVPDWTYLKLAAHVNNLTAPFRAMFASNPERHHFFEKLGANQDEVRKKGRNWRGELKHYLENGRFNNLLISGEGISIIDDRGISRLKEFLSPYCDEIRIVAYVRPPMAFISSMLQQYIKNGETAFELEKRKTNYRARFEKFDKHFGRENVHLWKFDSAHFTRGCLVADFCGRIGLSLPDGMVVRANESLSREALGLLLAYRKFGPGYGVGKTVRRENNTIIEALYRVPGVKFKLAKEVLDPVIEKLKIDIEWMEERLGESLTESVKPADTDIRGEAELLQIGAGTGQEFARSFEKVTGLDVASFFPTEGMIEPHAAATLLEMCRESLRTKMKSRDTQDACATSP